MFKSFSDNYSDGSVRPGALQQTNEFQILFCPGGISLKYHKSVKMKDKLSANCVANVISYLESSKIGVGQPVSLVVSNHGLKISDIKNGDLHLPISAISFVICAAKQMKLAVIAQENHSNFVHILSSDKEEEILLLNETINNIFETNGRKMEDFKDTPIVTPSSHEESTTMETYSSMDSSNSGGSVLKRSFSLKKYFREHSDKSNRLRNKSKPTREADDIAETFVFVPMETFYEGEGISNGLEKSNESFKNDSGVCSFSSSPTKLNISTERPIAVDHFADFSSWYHPEFSREDAERHLSGRGVGCFVIRTSNTWNDCLVMSVLQCGHHKTVAHYLIRKDNKGRLFFDGHQESWDNIESLVAHLQIPLLKLFRSNQ